MVSIQNIDWIVQTLSFLATAFAVVMIFMKRDIKLPEVEGGLPFIGQAFVMLKGSPWDSMNMWIKKYGLTYKYVLFGSQCIASADPELLKIVLHKKVATFQKDVHFVLKPFMVLLGKGIVTSEGANWRRQRTYLSSALRIDILEVIPKMAVDAVHRLCKKLDAAKVTGESIEMAEEFRHLTLQVISEAVLSISAEESNETFAKMYLPIVEEANIRVWKPQRMYIPTPAWFKFNADVKKLNDYVSGIIVKRWNLKLEEVKVKQGVERERDLLDKVLEGYTPDTWGDEAIEQIRDEIKTFILAGHETSASMMTWALYELVNGKAKGTSTHLDTLMQEAKEVFRDYFVDDLTKPGDILKKSPKREVCDKLNFSDACMRESLRRYSVVPTVVRVPCEDVDFEGSADTPALTIPKGTTFMVNIMGVHHNPKYWPKPMEYDPHRFMKGMAAIEPYTFLPFVDGPRMCMGQFLSLLETKIVMSMLVSKYTFTVANDPPDAHELHGYMVPIIPKRGHFMKIS